MILNLIFLLTFVHAEDMKFESATLKIGQETIKVQVADTEARRMHGLMFVKSMAPNDGMLFVFDDERQLGFWMKNTLIPLNIGFFDGNGVLVDAQEMTPPESVLVEHPPSYTSKAPALFALEMNTGWFTKHHLKNGAKLSLAGPTASSLLKEKLKSTRPSSKASGG